MASSVSAVLLFTVAAALLCAVAALLSKFIAAWPEAPFGIPYSSSDAFHEQPPPPDLLQFLLEEASHSFRILLLDSTWAVLVVTFIILSGIVCCAFIGIFLRFVFRPILDALSCANQSLNKVGHAVIPTMEMDSAPAKVECV